MTEQLELTNEQLNTAAASCFLEGRLSTGKWYPTMSDKEAAAELAHQKGAKEGTYRVNKNKLAGFDTEWEEASSAISAVRTYWLRMTWPVSASDTGKADRGPRLVPAQSSELVMEIITHVNELIAEATVKVNTFLDVYPERIQQAIAANPTVTPAMFPSVEEVRRKFYVAVEFAPMPTITDFTRVPMDQNMVQFLGTRMAERQQVIIDNAMAKMMEELSTVVSKMAEQLTKHSSGEKTKLFGSLVTNVRDMNKLLRSSNYLDDPSLNELADAIDELTNHETKVLKASLGLSSDIADKAKEVVKRIEGMAGDKPPKLGPDPVYGYEPTDDDREAENEASAFETPAEPQENETAEKADNPGVEDIDFDFDSVFND